MRLSDIKKTLDDQLSWDELKKAISKEIEEYRKSLKTKGGSVPVYVVEDVERLVIGRQELKKILEVVLDHILNELEVNYIADALTLSNNIIFESETIREDVESLTDPEINGRLDEAIIKEMLKKI